MLHLLQHLIFKFVSPYLYKMGNNFDRCIPPLESIAECFITFPTNVIPLFFYGRWNGFGRIWYIVMIKVCWELIPFWYPLGMVWYRVYRTILVLFQSRIGPIRFWNNEPSWYTPNWAVWNGSAYLSHDNWFSWNGDKSWVGECFCYLYFVFHICDFMMMSHLDRLSNGLVNFFPSPFPVVFFFLLFCFCPSRGGCLALLLFFLHGLIPFLCLPSASTSRPDLWPAERN